MNEETQSTKMNNSRFILKVYLVILTSVTNLDVIVRNVESYH